MRKTIMVVGASYYQVPAIKVAKNMGLRVVAVDGDPRAPGLRYADQGACVDIIRPEECLAIAKEEKISGVLTIASNLAQLAASFIARELHLVAPRLEQVRTLFDKSSFYMLLEGERSRTAPWGEASTLAEANKLANSIGFPLILKPSDSAGSRGVRRLESLPDLRREFPVALSFSLKKTVILARFLKGKELGLQAFLIGGKAALAVVTEKIMTAPPYYVELGHLAPPDVRPEIYQQTISEAVAVAKGLGYLEGPLEADVILSPEGPVILEMGLRLGGSCLPQLVRAYTGVDITREVIKHALGETVTLEGGVRGPCCARLLFAKKEGRVTDVQVPEEVLLDSQLTEMSVDVKKGDFVNPAVSSNYRIGHVIARAPEAKLALKKAESLIEKIHLRIV